MYTIYTDVIDAFSLFKDLWITAGGEPIIIESCQDYPMPVSFLKDKDFSSIIEECLSKSTGGIRKEKLLDFENLNRINELYFVELFNLDHFNKDENLVTHVCLSSPENGITDLYIPLSEKNYKKVYYALKRFLSRSKKLNFL